MVNVESGGPADKAGILLGDVLVTFGATALEGIEDLQSVSDSGVVGNAVKLGVIRGGELKEVTVTVGERPGR